MSFGSLSRDVVGHNHSTRTEIPPYLVAMAIQVETIPYCGSDLTTPCWRNGRENAYGYYHGSCRFVYSMCSKSTNRLMLSDLHHFK